MRIARTLGLATTLVTVGCQGLALAQSPGRTSGPSRASSAAALLRPIGAPTAVDEVRRSSTSQNLAAQRRAGFVSSGPSPARPASRLVPTSSRVGSPPVRQAVWMQGDRSPLAAPGLPSGGFSFPADAAPAGPATDFGSSGGPSAPALPPSSAGGSTAPPSTSSPAPGGFAPAPGYPSGAGGTTPNRPGAPGPMPPAGAGGQGQGRALPSPPPVSGSADLAPVPQPRMGDEFARADNCACVSYPSAYRAASGIGCATPAYAVPATYAAPAPYTPPPAEIAAPAVMPPPGVPVATAISPTAAPARSLFTLGQETLPVEVGQGLWGQPVAYVPGQRCRNWLRYFSP